MDVQDSAREPGHGCIPHPGVGTDGETAVYRIYDQESGLLYVGMSSNPLNRWAAHAEKHDWWPRAATYRVDWFPTRAEAAAEELRAIKAEAPTCNRWAAEGWGKYAYAKYMARLEENRVQQQ
ncbi:GIY-YIG nuclease family protein [Streptomyces xanthochromogenes]|uniref:GIY-YIG nuclease family protein n=1 Tax=Streptomyces xanthochromogenes TaxID=67384 RepID=UPI0034264BA7